jgi:hypothetical protein
MVARGVIAIAGVFVIMVHKIGGLKHVSAFSRT